MCRRILGKRARKIRDKINKKQNGRCFYCNCIMTPIITPLKYIPTMLTLDHLTPISEGGSNNQDNMVCACAECNRSRGNTGDWKVFYVYHHPKFKDKYFVFDFLFEMVYNTIIKKLEQIV